MADVFIREFGSDALEIIDRLAEILNLDRDAALTRMFSLTIGWMNAHESGGEKVWIEREKSGNESVIDLAWDKT